MTCRSAACDKRGWPSLTLFIAFLVPHPSRRLPFPRQERLAFRSQGVIAHLIEGYRAETATRRVAVSVPASLADGRRATITDATYRGDLDYPAVLVAHQLRLRSNSGGGSGSAAAPAPEADEAAAAAASVLEAPRFPPLAATISLLASTHRALERGSFEVLAQVGGS